MAKLVYRGEMQRITGKSEESIEAQNMYEVMRYISRHYGAPARLTMRRCLVALDGVRLDKPASRGTAVTAEGEIYFFPLCGGG